MGYTHYWQQNRPFTDIEWAIIRKGARRIFQRATEKGITLVLEHNIPDPPEASRLRIRFNGWEEDGHETFWLDKTWQPDLENQKFSFCKTARKPYDAAVVAVLMLAAKTAPGALEWSSDGANEPCAFEAGEYLLEAAG